MSHASAVAAQPFVATGCSRYGNLLLDALPDEVAERVVRASTYFHLPVGTMLFPRFERPRFGYLLTSGLVSVVYTTRGGGSLELSMIGNEGLAGWMFLLGGLPAVGETDIQVEGEGYRVPLASLRQEFAESAEFRRRVLQFVQLKSLSSYQIAACNRLHRARARFSRWLLTASDRTGLCELNMTQEFLAGMLGTRRTTVTEEASDLQRQGAIEYSRGSVRILNRDVLESNACECYAIIRDQYRALYREEAAAE